MLELAIGLLSLPPSEGSSEQELEAAICRLSYLHGPFCVMVIAKSSQQQVALVSTNRTGRGRETKALMLSRTHAWNGSECCYPGDPM